MTGVGLIAALVVLGMAALVFLILRGGRGEG